MVIIFFLWLILVERIFEVLYSNLIVKNKLN